MATYKFSTVSEALPTLLSNLLLQGDEVGSRNGRVMEFLNTQITLTDPVRREVLNPGRGANVFAQIAETMWVLAGRNDITWLSPYLPRAIDYSDDGKTWRGGYGSRIRNWDVGLDQLAHAVDTLTKDPLSRRAVIAIYDPSRDLPAGKDVPCNDFLQFQNRLGQLHLTVTVRSNDVMWGWSGINAFEWSTLQEIVAHLLGISVGTLTFNIGNLHIYEAHWVKAARIEPDCLESRVGYEHTPFRLPEGAGRNLETVDLLVDRWFEWEAMCRKGTATIEEWVEFEEPLFKSWAAAIAYFWSRDSVWLEVEGVRGTALGVAMARTPTSVLPAAPQTSRNTAAGVGHNPQSHERVRAFYAFVKDLHAAKHASYGDSWKKRGEKMSILANMARKVDRLGVGDEFDSSADTVIDLLVYSIKYWCWLAGEDDGPDNVNLKLSYVLAETEEIVNQSVDIDIAIVDIVSDFDYYCDKINADLDVGDKKEFVEEFAKRLAPIARDLWYEETYGTADHDGDDYRPDLGQ